MELEVLVKYFTVFSSFFSHFFLFCLTLSCRCMNNFSISTSLICTSILKLSILLQNNIFWIGFAQFSPALFLFALLVGYGTHSSSRFPFSLSLSFFPHSHIHIQGEIFLFRSALGLLNYHSKSLIKTSFEECVMSLRQLPQNIEEEVLFDSIFVDIKVRFFFFAIVQIFLSDYR